ncbi:MAG: helix-turn-helix domain-containing protein [Pseudomonadota bacterium]|nr:helix-turn-helix domain-containing protein [Pseudomonadota bacterium]
MPKRNLNRKTTPYEILGTLERLGANLALARKRRGWRQADLAEKLGVSRQTIVDMEHGKPTVAAVVYASALWAFNLLGDLKRVAAPEADDVGTALEAARSRKRVRVSSTGMDDAF